MMLDILVTSWNHHPHRKQGLAAAALTLVLLLSACATPTQPTALPPADSLARPLAAARLANLQQAAYYYNRYHALAPDDLLGLKKLAEVCTALEEAGVEDESCREAAERVMGSVGAGEQGSGGEENLPSAICNSPAAALREALAARTDDRRIVAEMLGVPVESVELGPNLVENGGFKMWENSNPDGWRLGIYLGQSGGEGLYVAGKDTLIVDAGVARITALWGGMMPDGTITYAEYVGEGIPAIDMKYLISLYYRSSGFIEGSAFVFLGEYTRSNGLVLVYNSLPDSNGQWRVTYLLVDGPAVPTAVVPLARNWGVGQLEILGLAVKPIVYGR